MKIKKFFKISFQRDTQMLNQFKNKQKTPSLKPLQFKTIKNNYNSKQKKTGQWH